MHFTVKITPWADTSDSQPQPINFDVYDNVLCIDIDGRELQFKKEDIRKLIALMEVE